MVLKGPQATGGDFVTLAELMIRAVNGYVSPEAEAAFWRASDRVTASIADALAAATTAAAISDASRIAAIRLSGRATPFPAMSKPVP